MFFEKQQIDKPYKDIFKEMYYEAKPQTNYHGTPYTFDKFDDSKWLTGEGFAAHGPGHYSADYFSTADRYNPGVYSTFEIANKTTNEPIRFKPTYKLDWGFTANKFDIVDYLRQAIKEHQPIVDGYYTNSMVEQIPEARDVLQNLGNYKEIKEKHVGNTYKVNTPNEYFMWKEGNDLQGQSKYIQDLWKRRNIDFSKYLGSATTLDHDLEGINPRNINKIFGPMYKQMEYRNGLNDVTKRLFNKYMNELPLEKQLKFLERTDNKNKINEITKGIKGIRAIGLQDGPINVTFSGDDIKMANTPWQRFKNRIPLNSLGALANKIISSPWFRAANEYAVPFQAGLDYYPQLDLILEKDPKEYSKKYNKYMNITPNNPGYMDEQGYLNY